MAHQAPPVEPAWFPHLPTVWEMREADPDISHEAGKISIAEASALMPAGLLLLLGHCCRISGIIS